jgi:type II secretory ATPase GspE/PulE/Tfp pilus assembly ATPase PilB-like protein
MIGEIRDLETAEIAIRASLTGHLVFSTLHTNDALGGISRLIDMGVEPFLVSAAVRAFLAQRLVRRLCRHCKVPRVVTDSDRRELGMSLAITGQAYSPGGCDQCRNTGFSGRLAIYEMVLLTPAMQDLIAHSAHAQEIRNQAARDGYLPMRGYGWDKVMQGETTIEEVVSVTSSDIGGAD